MRRNVNRKVYSDRENVSAITLFSCRLWTCPNHRRRPLRTTSSVGGRFSSRLMSSFRMCTSLDTLKIPWNIHISMVAISPRPAHNDHEYPFCRATGEVSTDDTEEDHQRDRRARGRMRDAGRHLPDDLQWQLRQLGHESRPLQGLGRRGGAHARVRLLLGCRQLRRRRRAVRRRQTHRAGDAVHRLLLQGVCRDGSWSNRWVYRDK